jgi:hypothetical protein
VAAVGGTGDQAAIRLGLLCERLAEWPTVPPIFHEFLAKLRAGVEPSDFDAMSRLALEIHPPGLSRDRIFQDLPTGGAGHPQLDVLVCPRKRCARVEAPPASGDDPVCPVFAEQLARLRLDT